jgi:hypothetical protein
MHQSLLTRGAFVGALLLAAWSARAAPVELVVNGEFETPGIGANTWTCTSVTGWTASNGVGGCLEIWGSVYNPEANLPALGSDGLAHGQHHELTYANDTEYTTQAAAISSAGTVDFSFDGWRRGATGIIWSLSGSLSGLLAGGTESLTDNDWHAVSVTNLAVQAGETLTMRFQSTGQNANYSCGTGCGAHIDQVSLKYEAPEPASVALVGASLLGLALTRRRRAVTV